MFQPRQVIFAILATLLLPSLACAFSGSTGANAPDSPYQLGLLAVEQGNFEIAYQYFDDAVAENPEHAESYFYRAYSLHQTYFVEQPTLAPPTKPPDPEIPDPPPEPADQTDTEAVSEYLEQLVQYQQEVEAIQEAASQDFVDYEKAIAEYQATAVTLNTEMSTAQGQIIFDLGRALDLGLPHDLEKLALELLDS